MRGATARQATRVAKVCLKENPNRRTGHGPPLPPRHIDSIYENVDAAEAIHNVAYEVIIRAKSDRSRPRQVILAEVRKDFGQTIGRTIDQHRLDHAETREQ
jgi:hypothetical protein